MRMVEREIEKEVDGDGEDMEKIAAEAGVDFLEGSDGGGTSGAVVAITIPSIEYPDQYKAFLPEWRQEFKDEGVVHCPNYKVIVYFSSVGCTTHVTNFRISQ